MGIVIPFRPRQASFAGAFAPPQDRPTGDADQVILDIADLGGDRHDVLEAAADLLAICRDRYGLTVMQHGLPRDPTVLASALSALLGGLVRLEPISQGRKPFPGICVYCGHPALAWIEDGSGARIGLAAPDQLRAQELSAFLRPLLVNRRRS